MGIRIILKGFDLIVLLADVKGCEILGKVVNFFHQKLVCQTNRLLVVVLGMILNYAHSLL